MMKTTKRISHLPSRVFIAMLACSCAGIAFAQPQPQPREKPTAPPMAARDIQKHIGDLNSPSWRTREFATSALMDAGPAAYDALRTAFRVSTSYELRRRIRDVAHEIYMTQSAGPIPAFLGVRFGLGVETRVAPDVGAMTVNDVVALSAAETAGIRPGDVIFAANGKAMTAENYPKSFTYWIRSQRAGTQAELSLLRGAQGITVQRPESLEDRKRLSQFKVTPVATDVDPRVPPGLTALRIDGIDEPVNGVNLIVGDLIVGLDPVIGRMAFAPKSAAELTKWAIEEPKLPENERAPLVPIPQPGNRPPTPKPVLYALRGGEAISVMVSLGRYDRTAPMDFDMSERFRERNKAEPAFELWWQQTFDPKGLVAENKNVTDPSWRLTPHGKQR